MIQRFLTRPAIHLLTLALLGLGACGGDDADDDGGGGDGVPAAPSGLAVEELEGGAHVTWTDNSDNETQFMLMRKDPGGDYEIIASPPFDTTQYHDAVLTAATTYTYMVMAMNDAGESEGSNEVEFTAP